MTTISVTPEQIRIEGHADYGPKGYDIICEAVTCLTQTYLKSIHDLGGDDPPFDLYSGYFAVDITHLSEVSRTLTSAFFIGLCLLVEGYPDFVRIDQAGMSLNSQDY